MSSVLLKLIKEVDTLLRTNKNFQLGVWTRGAVLKSQLSGNGKEAEQCNHHPPISAFYLENQKKQYCVNGYIWTKSHFTGNSAMGSMLGKIEVFLPKFDEQVRPFSLLHRSTTRSSPRSRARVCSSGRCACS